MSSKTSIDNLKYIADWMVSNWRAGIAFIYCVICVFDFIIYPSFIGLTRVDFLDMIETLHDLDPEIQRDILAKAYHQFTPYTLQGSGLFHLSFGALLTGAAITKHGKT